MPEKFKVTVSPHVFSGVSVKTVMLRVITGLSPAIIFSVYLWGMRAVYLYAVSIAGSVLSEWAFLKIRKRPFRNDFSAVLTGILFAMVMPPGLPLVYAFIGVSFGIIFGKHFFGGLGQNVFNPALLGRVFLMASFPVAMTTWISPLDGVTSASPLGSLKFSREAWEVSKVFLGNCPGSLGETSALLIILGGIYIIVRKAADFRIPAAYIGTFFLLSGIYYFFKPAAGSPVFHIFAGGIMLGAFFMATDPVTAPANYTGRIIYGAGCGVFTFIIRYFSGYPEGVMFSILLMNSFAPLLERLPNPRVFGAK